MNDRYMFVRSTKLDPVDVNNITETPLPLHDGETVISMAVEGEIVHVLVIYSKIAAARHERREYPKARVGG